MLSQLDDEGQNHPIAYFSRKLLRREERNSTIEKECMAIKLGIQSVFVKETIRGRDRPSSIGVAALTEGEQ